VGSSDITHPRISQSRPGGRSLTGRFCQSRQRDVVTIR
jgi:hypothetical protein